MKMTIDEIKDRVKVDVKRIGCNEFSISIPVIDEDKFIKALSKMSVFVEKIFRSGIQGSSDILFKADII